MMLRRSRFLPITLFLTVISTGSADYARVEPAEPRPPQNVRKGTLEMDTWLMDNYGPPGQNSRDFYLKAREHLAASPSARLSDPAVIALAQELGIPFIGGPLLGELASNAISIWFRPSSPDDLVIHLTNDQANKIQYPIAVEEAGYPVRQRIEKLKENTPYTYTISTLGGEQLASGSFQTAPAEKPDQSVRITFGADFHKIGLHNPNLFHHILEREPLAMFFYGDIAADGRRNQLNMVEADYLLRDTSQPWSRFAARTPVYTSWDDWDYFANDRSGLDKHISVSDRQDLREIWRNNWINPLPHPQREGIYFKTRLGPVEYFMLDTRSCRESQRKGDYASFLGKEQHEWLKQGLKESTAPFKIISSGTMWSDYVSEGKDSWGIWDTAGREDIFSLIEEESIGGVLLISGDRHGARGFRIPRKSGFEFYEFGVGSLGGIKGPKGLVDNCPEQIFGYTGFEAIAFGEFTFDTSLPDPEVTFRLINDHGTVLEEHVLNLSRLTPTS
ncbi:MAG: alkaline phosphatase D family protein [Verrucomicrobiota bacterium]